MASSSSSSSVSLPMPPIIPSIFKPKPREILKFLPSPSAIHLSSTQSSKKAIHFNNPCCGIAQKRIKIWRSNAASSGEVLPTESTPLENSQDMVSSSSGDASIISILFFAAFIVLSILTIGVIYIGVTDFLQKREREKFEKEEAAKKKKKKGGKKVKARPRAGPRGFGQKIDEFDDADDD